MNRTLPKKVKSDKSGDINKGTKSASTRKLHTTVAKKSTRPKTAARKVQSLKPSQPPSHSLLQLPTAHPIYNSCRSLVDPPRRNLPKSQQKQQQQQQLDSMKKLNAQVDQTATDINSVKKTQNPTSSYPKTFQQDYVQVMKDELDDLKSTENQTPDHHMVQPDTTPQPDFDPNAPLDPKNLSKIYGTQAKLVLPDIPTNGSQAFWAIPEDPNNPFSFPIFNLSPLLSPTDLSVSIDPKDSDVPAEKILDDYQSMMATTVQQGSGQNFTAGQKYNLNKTSYSQDDLDESLNNIANPHKNNPLSGMVSANPGQALNAAGPGQAAQMATSRVPFGQTVLVTTPVRKSQLKGIQSVFKIVLPGDAKNSTTNVVPTETDPTKSNPLNSVICLAKASDSNKRFDVFLNRAAKNDTKSPTDQQANMQALLSGEPSAQQDDEGKNDKPTLIFTSNVSHNSLKKTKARLKKQSDDLIEALAKKNKTYDPPLQEHVCMERNYLLELDRDPSLIAFPFSDQDPNKNDPITHFLAFPMRASTITFATDDPLQDPSNDLNYRLAEAEFLIQCCLMGQNFPAPIDPRFVSLIEQDRNRELDAEESSKAREVIGRSVVAMYGHGSGLAAERWSLKRPMIKPELYKRELPSTPPKTEINHELDLSYGHNHFYQTLYNFSLLPSEEEIANNLNRLKKQMLEMSASNEELLQKISHGADEVFGITPGGGDTSGDGFKQIDFSSASAQEIEAELTSRMKQIEQRQYQFQQQLDEQIRVDGIQRRRAAKSMGLDYLSDDGEDDEYEGAFEDQVDDTGPTEQQFRFEEPTHIDLEQVHDPNPQGNGNKM